MTMRAASILLYAWVITTVALAGLALGIGIWGTLRYLAVHFLRAVTL